MRPSRIGALLWLGIACRVVRDADRFSDGNGASGPCKLGGQGCELSSECCTNTCNQGECAVCNVVGEFCDGPSQCCSGICSGDQCAACTATNEPCTPGDARCCPGLSCLTASGVHRCVAEGACLNEAPPVDPESTLAECDSMCASATGEDRTPCYVSCVDQLTPLSTSCAGCYAGWWLCTIAYCSANPCCATCSEFFTYCSGLDECPGA